MQEFFWLEKTTKFLVQQQKSSFKDWTSFCVREMNFIFACSVLASNLALLVSHGKQQWAAACRGLRWSQWRKFAAYWDSAWQSARLGTVWQHRPQLPWWNFACGNQQEKKGWWHYFWNGSLPECWPNWRRQILQGALVQSNAFCD